MGLRQSEQQRWPSKHQEFYANFLDMTVPVTNRACLANSPNQANFRQFGDDDMAVGIDLSYVDRGFVIRDFKSAIMQRGNGDVAMACLTEIADDTKTLLELEAFPGGVRNEKGDFEPVIPHKKLVQFYESHRFFLSPKEHQLLPKMIRPPQINWN